MKKRSRKTAAKKAKTKKRRGAKKKGARATKAKPAKSAVDKRVEVKTAAASSPGSKGTKRSAIEAAAEVLQHAGKPMRCKELIEAMEQRGLWKSPAGKTPHATLYTTAAMLPNLAA